MTKEEETYCPKSNENSDLDKLFETRINKILEEKKDLNKALKKLLIELEKQNENNKNNV